MNSIHILLDSLIDYAGLFPPAGLKMSEAVQNYATYRNGEWSSALGRFILPLSRLSEFEKVSEEYLGRDTAGTPWRVSVLGGADPDTDISQIADFNRRRGFNSSEGRAVVEALELRAPTIEDIHRHDPAVTGELEIYYEIPISERMPKQLAVIGSVDARAKVRTGGLSADQFPSCAHLARFICLCSEAHIPFKATAGLHHPLRSAHPYGYEADSPIGIMHGFLNVFMSAAFQRAGMGVDDAEKLLNEESVGAFAFAEDGVTWREHSIGNAALLAAREQFALSFGSCSFEEPIRDLKELNLI